MRGFWQRSGCLSACRRSPPAPIGGHSTKRGPTAQKPVTSRSHSPALRSKRPSAFRTAAQSRHPQRLAGCHPISIEAAAGGFSMSGVESFAENLELPSGADKKRPGSLRAFTCFESQMAFKRVGSSCPDPCDDWTVISRNAPVFEGATQNSAWAARRGHGCCDRDRNNRYFPLEPEVVHDRLLRHPAPTVQAETRFVVGPAMRYAGRTPNSVRVCIRRNRRRDPPVPPYTEHAVEGRHPARGTHGYPASQGGWRR